MRKVTSSPGGAGAGASLHRGGAAARGAPAPKAPSSAGTAQRRYACAGDLRESSRAAEEEGEDGPHTVAPCRGAAPPRRPHTVRLGSSARLRAKLQESCPLPSAVEVS